MAKPPKTTYEAVDVKLLDVVLAIEMLQNRGKLEAFKKALEKSDLKMTAGRDTIDFVKKFIVDNDLQDEPIGARIAPAAVTRGPYDCQFGSRRNP